MLDELPISLRYRNGPESIARSFLIPVLETAVSYDRAAGYFTSTSLSLAARGLTGLIRNGGSMRLIASPVLSAEDVAAIKDGYEKRDVIERSVLASLQEAPASEAAKNRLGFLAWMIQHGVLDIRLALVTTEDGVGIYHEKFGVIRDDVGNEIGFIGSSNESGGGLKTNYESIDVYRSWMPNEPDRIAPLKADFEAHWHNRTPGLEIMKFPDAARRELLRLRPPTEPKWDPAEIVDGSREFGIPDHVVLRGYQKDAIRAWFDARGRGVLAMATGTGKTITAASAMVKVWEKMRQSGEGLLVVVVAPYKHLVDQWSQELSAFGLPSLKCFESSEDWKHALADEVAALNSNPVVTAVIATTATFVGDTFRQQLSFARCPVMLIADEVHNLGAPHIRSRLPSTANFRMGLSATPERHRDDVGTQAVFDYFGPVVHEFSLGRAIEEGFLTPYEYQPVLVELDGDEIEQYRYLTRRISKLMAMDQQDPDADGMSEGPLKQLLIKRARLLGSASGKIGALTAQMPSNPIHTLVYCSDSRLDPLGPSPGPKQIDAVIRLLGKEHNISVARYTAETPTETRRELRREFADGSVEVIAAIRCLDEGVDIPETRTAHILASSTNPRQFIQRRGRILRKSPGKEFAFLYDYITVPPEGALNDEDTSADRRLLRRELGRVAEFASASRNADTALRKLLDLRVRYDLLDA